VSHSDKVISLPGTVKGRLLFVATVLRMRSAFPFPNHTFPPHGKPDMHPVDLILDSSMPVRQKFKFNGVPDAIKSLQGSSDLL